MKNKTLGELMDMPVTDELKREVSKRVVAAQGENPCDRPCHPCDEQQAESDDKCVKCGKPMYTHRPIPDYTRPENFWPLLWKMYRQKKRPVQSGSGVDDCMVIRWLNDKNNEIEDFVTHPDPGLAVEFAYLKMEESE